MHRRLLIVLDARTVAKAALREGITMAKAFGADVLFLSVLPNYSVALADVPPLATVSPHEMMQTAKDDLTAQLDEAVRAAAKSGVVARSLLTSGEDDAQCIVEAAQTQRCDLIVIATEGRNALVRLLTGSPIPGLITASPVPVLVCKTRTRAATAHAAVPTPLLAAAAGNRRRRATARLQ
jgi:nucleotide-binding universal stress UspA family protein